MTQAENTSENTEMTKTTSENTETLRYFRAYFYDWAKKTGLNQNKIARRLKIGQSQVNEILSGKRGASLGRMEEIVKKTGLGCFMEALLKGQELCGEKKETMGLTPFQIEALLAFRECLIAGGEAAEMLAWNALHLARKKQGPQKPSPRQLKSKSA